MRRVFTARSMMMSMEMLLFKIYKRKNISFKGVSNKTDLPTGCCNILVSPDGERTMATHIGIGSQLNPDEVNEDILNSIDHVYMESYLWDHELTKKTTQKNFQILQNQKT